MLLLVGLELMISRQDIKFQYNLCYCQSKTKPSCSYGNSISIQLMLLLVYRLFICRGSVHIFQYNLCYCQSRTMMHIINSFQAFQYNLCYCQSQTNRRRSGRFLISIQLMLLLVFRFYLPRHRQRSFQYNLCYCQSASALAEFEPTIDFNTTYVTVSLLQGGLTALFRGFQYNLCYCQSLKTQIKTLSSEYFNTTYVTVSRVTGVDYGTVVKFQYNLCYCQSCSWVESPISIAIISIQLMLLLVTTTAHTPGRSLLISIQLMLLLVKLFGRYETMVMLFQYNLCYCQSACICSAAWLSTYFNTTYVTVSPFSLFRAFLPFLFQYNLCYCQS